MQTNQVAARSTWVGIAQMPTSYSAADLADVRARPIRQRWQIYPGVPAWTTTEAFLLFMLFLLFLLFLLVSWQIYPGHHTAVARLQR